MELSNSRVFAIAKILHSKRTGANCAASLSAQERFNTQISGGLEIGIIKTSADGRNLN
jgi:hypothetical protein